jgi:hypothetical protein
VGPAKHASDHPSKSEAGQRKRRWRSLPGLPEYEVSELGELRGAITKRHLNQKHAAAIWRKVLEDKLWLTAPSTSSCSTRI